MRNRGFNVIALDANYQIVALLRCTNIQWNRKYYEPGIFSIQIPLKQYDASYAYIFTKDRPEMGIIEQINYVDQKGYRAFNISGHFLENELNDRVVYRNGETNILNTPSWINQTGTAEDVAFAYFESFKDVIFSDGISEYSCLLGIQSGISESRGLYVEHERGGELLGNKIYSILKPSEMSYRVEYDFEENKKVPLAFSGGMDSAYLLYAAKTK